MKKESADRLLWDEMHRVVGCAIEVSNTLGHGFLEKPYENALVVEFGLEQIPYRQQPHYEMDYKGTIVGEYVPDLICFDQLVVDTKVIDRISKHEIGQMLNYLKVTGLRVGLVLNFKHERLEWQRIVL